MASPSTAILVLASTALEDSTGEAQRAFRTEHLARVGAEAQLVHLGGHVGSFPTLLLTLRRADLRLTPPVADVPLTAATDSRVIVAGKDHFLLGCIRIRMYLYPFSRQPGAGEGASLHSTAEMEASSRARKARTRTIRLREGRKQALVLMGCLEPWGWVDQVRTASTCRSASRLAR